MVTRYKFSEAEDEENRAARRLRRGFPAQIERYGASLHRTIGTVSENEIFLFQLLVPGHCYDHTFPQHYKAPKGNETQIPLPQPVEN